MVKFGITMLKVTDEEVKKEEAKKEEGKSEGPTYLITFSRRSGDRVHYNEICSNIKRLLDV
jgi:hypothetical protein